MTEANPQPRRTDEPSDPLPVGEAAALADRVVENVERVIVGHHDATEHIVTAILARGHLLLDDVPGVGKTMLARSLARSIDCEFSRVQFTPDLLPTDVTGVNVFDERTREFEFRPGPVFGNVVLADEINRAPPKTQSALLEAMEEAQVTVDGDTYRLDQPFTVIATQNDVEADRTYDLPIAEVDRFMKRLALGYPSPADESEVLRRVTGRHPIEELEPVATGAEVRCARETVANVTTVDESRDEGGGIPIGPPSREQTVLGGLVAVGLLAAARRTGALARVRRAVWLRWQPRRDPETDVVRAFDRLEYLLAREYRERRPGETPREYLAAVDTRDGLDDRAARVGSIYERVRYAGDAEDGIADEAVALVDELVRERRSTVR